MAKRQWKFVAGNRFKRWKQSDNESGCEWRRRVPPHWYRNYLNRKERRRSKRSIETGNEHNGAFVHPRTAAWYW